ncbi:MAG: ABC transporter ATP-binding protein [Desulfobacter sp.]|nr:MAG: ABC transporter ATP-binding protein [Desulfobacter sp.]
MSTPILEITGLSHCYGSLRGGISNINLAVNHGEYLILAGPNGSGKTTLIRHMNGLLKPDKGEIRLAGKNIFKNLAHTRKTIGMVFQDADTQIVGETVFDEAAFGPENLGMDRKTIDERVGCILESFDLDRFRDRHPASLSGGEKRKLTIAGILVMDPEIIIFDEPFANLDYPAVLDLARIIRGLNRTGKTIIMATHDLDQVLGDAHRLMIMDNGETAALGAADALAPELGRYGLKPLCTCGR